MVCENKLFSKDIKSWANTHYNTHNMPKCHGGHPIFHWGLKLSSKISAGKFEKCRDSIERDVTLAKIKNARKASHHLTLMDNCQTLCSLCKGPKDCCCDLIPKNKGS